MSEISEIYTRTRKYIFFLLAFYVLGWGFTPYQSVFLGLILGTSLSLFNLRILVKKMSQFSEVMVHGGKMRSLGMLSRMAAAVLAVILAIEYPENLHLVSVVLGLMTAYPVIMIDYFFHPYHLQK